MAELFSKKNKEECQEKDKDDIHLVLKGEKNHSKKKVEKKKSVKRELYLPSG